MQKVRSKLQELLEAGKFVFTVEVQPPKNASKEEVIKKLSAIKGFADAVNLTDCSTASVSMSSLAASLIALEEGLEPVWQMTCRDRNRIALQAELLGAYALGVRNLLCMTGDHPLVGDHPQAKPVYDLDSVQLISLVKGLERGSFFNGRPIKGEAPKFFLGAVENPFATPLYFRVLRLKKKALVGAKFIQTQGIFNLKKFEEFLRLAREEGVLEKIFLIAGIIPPRSFKMLKYMKERVPGMDIPEEWIKRMASAKDQREEGIRIAVDIGKALKEMSGVRGLHIMLIGWEEALPEIVKALR
jgi:5,10-methylenetetrahydrofolate reductase